MNDLYHYIGGDLSTSPVGDLMPVSDIERGRQRILRRLMTNPGDYIQHPDYGAGLGQKVGDIVNVGEWTALIRGQMLLEDSVASSPAPQISVQSITNGATVYIAYTDAPSGQAVTLGFDVTR
jgi:phage baseplate assembly protein W